MAPHTAELAESRLLRTFSRLTLIILSCTIVAVASQVNVRPGQNIVGLVNNNPPGTTFVIYPGTYPLTTPIVPKSGDQFIGQTVCAPPKTACPAILTGSRVLTSFQHSGSYYYVTGQTQRGLVVVTSTQCVPGYFGCQYPEDLFFDGKPLLHVAALADVVSGTWFFDYATHTIYFYDNPTGHKVETSVTRAAFQSDGNHVTIKYLTVKGFAVPITFGAIGISGNASTTKGANWVIENNEVLLNHGTGVRVNFGSQVLNNYLHDNGELGIGGGTLTNAGPNGVTPPTQPSGILIQGNKISHNNFAFVKPEFGAGGVKIGNTRGVILRGNYIHDNLGDGFHADTNNIEILAEGNTVNYNTEQGLFNEIGYSAIFRNNVLEGNGYTHPNGSDWLYASSILSSTSQKVEAYCNTVTVVAQGGNAMGIIQQPRSGYNYISRSNYFHHNTVLFGGKSGWSGAATPQADPVFYTSNKSDYNDYHEPALTAHTFAYKSAVRPFTQFQTEGAEPHGSADTNYLNSAPVVAITSPAEGADVSGAVTIKGTATDSAGIGKIELYVDWTLKSTASGTSPFVLDWSTSGMSAGSHILTAMAYSTSGIRACYAINVNVP